MTPRHPAYLRLIESGIDRTAFPLAFDSWSDDERAALQRVIASGRFTMGPEVSQFEAEFAAYFGAQHAIMVSSGSTANLLMAAALRFRTSGAVPPGSEVVVPAVGWSTTYFPFAQHGYRLRFVDADRATLNVDCDALTAAISPETRAVVVVNILGNPCDFDAISAVIAAAEARYGHEIALLEDNCESLGATYGGRACGTIGLLGSFSFFFSHHLSTMEGGMVCTNDRELAEIVTCLRAHGWTRDVPADSPLAAGEHDPFQEAFRFVLPGYNVRPLELSAAVGRVQLGRFEGFLDRRRANAHRWVELMEPLAPWFRIQQQPATGSWFGFSIVLEPEAPFERATVVAALEAAGVQCRPVVSGNFARQPALRHIDHTVSGPLAAADEIHERGLYVGNAERPLEEELELVASTLSSLVPHTTFPEAAVA